MTAASPTTDRASAADRRSLTANATLAFVLAGMVNSVLHEGAHATAGLILGLGPTISPFSVSYATDGSANEQIITASAGPVFSLVMGLVLMNAARRWGSGFGRLFWMWLSFMGVMNFVGYLFIAPFAQAGDTGKALALWGATTPVFIASALVGVGGQFLLARRFAVEVKRYTRSTTEERQLAYFPWLIGTPIVIVLSLAELLLLAVPPVVLVIVLAYSVAFGIFAPMQFIFRSKVSNTYEALELRPVYVPGVVATVAVAVVLIALAGAGGLPLG
ncbi:MAG TPA: hypothetical protein VIT20_08745 [Propionibacteriaceae bacterium]